MSREPGVPTRPEPEWDGPDLLREMVERGAHRMVPVSRVAEARDEGFAAGFAEALDDLHGNAAEAVRAALISLRERVAGLVIRDDFGEPPDAAHEHIDGPCGFRASILAEIDRALE